METTEIIQFFMENVLTREAAIALIINWMFVEFFKSNVLPPSDGKANKFQRLYRIIVPYKAMISGTIFVFITFKAFASPADIYTTLFY